MNRRRLVAAACVVAFALSGCQAGEINQGADYLKEENYEKAVESFQKAVEKESGEKAAQAYKGMGMAYWEMGDYKKAKESLESALENGVEETAAIYNMLGCAAMEEESYDEADGYFEKGLSMEEISEELEQEMKYNQVICYENQAKWEEAKTAIETYVKEYPDDAKAAREAEFLRTR